MALPFILGVAVGAGAVYAYNNNEKIKEKADKFLGKSKEKACELVNEVKTNVEATKECIKEKTLNKKEDEIKKEENEK